MPETASAGTAPAGLPSPGQLDSHYAPVKPLYLLPRPAAQLTDEDVARVAHRAAGAPELGLLLQSSAAPEAAARELERRLAGPGVRAVALSPDGDLATVARALFASLRALDASPAQLLLAEPCAIDRGLGHAIADRLTRASRGKV